MANKFKKTAVQLFMISSILLFASNAFAVDFCHTENSLLLIEKLTAIKQEITKIQKTDLVLTKAQSTTMDEALSSLLAGKDSVSEVNNQVSSSVTVMLTPVQQAIKQAESVLEKNVPVANSVSTDFAKVVNEAMAKLSASTKVAVAGKNNLDLAKDKAIQVKTTTQFFEQLYALVAGLSAKALKQCAAPDFEFSARSSDGQLYHYRDCADSIVNSPEAAVWGGPVKAGSCRYVLECFVEKIDPVKDLFPGTGFQYILDCKQESGKCPIASICAQRVDGGGTSTITVPNVPGGRVEQ